MNKIALALMLSLVCSSAVYAQTTAAADVNTSTYDLDLDNAEIRDLGNERTQLQIRAGMGFGTLTRSPTPTDAKSGTNFAAMIDLPVATGSTFNTGINYVQKGAAISGDDVRINYLVIPVQMKANFGHPRAFRWNIGLGPYVGIKTSTSGANTPDVSSYDLGGRGSLGLEFPLQPRYSILANADYDVGIKTIANDIRTRSVLVSLGLGIEI